jgi:DNA-binding transcriptional regulator LsrR (DeoR family)
MDHVDTLVTGLSSIDVDILPVYRPHLITQEDIPILQRAGVVGDLALHLIVESEEMDRNSPERQLVETINSLIVGAEPSDFVKVAERARKADSEGLGVVVLSVGAWKARILTTAIRMGAVTELITDMDTALAIARHVGVHVPSRASAMRARP